VCYVDDGRMGIAVKNKNTEAFFEEMEERKGVFTEDDIQKLRSLSKSDDYEQRCRVAELLWNCKQEFAEELLLELTHDKNEVVRADAADSISVGCGEETFQRLLYLMENDANRLVRSYAVLSSYDVLNNMLQESPSEIRDEKLADYGEMLHELVEKERENDVELSYCEVFCYLGEDKFFSALVKALETSSNSEDPEYVWHILHTMDRVVGVTTHSQMYLERLKHCRKHLRGAQRDLFDKTLRKVEKN
jgi:hypothetical protein